MRCPYCDQVMRFGRVEIDGLGAGSFTNLTWMPAEKRWGGGTRLFGFWQNRAANLCDGCGAVVLQPPD